MHPTNWFQSRSTLFHDRVDAGRQLAKVLEDYASRPNVVVLALPRGGVPVGYEVARALNAELDVLIVRKLGYPGHEELAIGAIASGGIQVLNEGIPVAPEVVESIVRDETLELQRREKAYRGRRPTPVLNGRCVILVDDGLATGATMRAAIAAVRQRRPQHIVVAVPVAPPGTIGLLKQEADTVICLHTPEDFLGIGQFYADFSQTGDDVVRSLLKQAWKPDDQKREPLTEAARSLE